MMKANFSKLDFKPASQPDTPKSRSRVTLLESIPDQTQCLFLQDNNGNVFAALVDQTAVEYDKAIRIISDFHSKLSLKKHSAINLVIKVSVNTLLQLETNKLEHPWLWLCIDDETLEHSSLVRANKLTKRCYKIGVCLAQVGIINAHHLITSNKLDFVFCETDHIPRISFHYFLERNFIYQIQSTETAEVIKRRAGLNLRVLESDKKHSLDETASLENQSVLTILEKIHESESNIDALDHAVAILRLRPKIISFILRKSARSLNYQKKIRTLDELLFFTGLLRLKQIIRDYLKS